VTKAIALVTSVDRASLTYCPYNYEDDNMQTLIAIFAINDQAQHQRIKYQRANHEHSGTSLFTGGRSGQLQKSGGAPEYGALFSQPKDGRP